LAAQLDSVRSSINYDLQIKADQVNSLASRIAALNLQISKVEVTGDKANDLRDQRDLLLDELSALARISYQERPNGFLDVFLDGRALVNGDETNQLGVKADAAGNVELAWASDGQVVNPGGGEIKADLDLRDGTLAQQRAALDALALAIVTEVNARHQTGYGLGGTTGVDFFSGTGAADISISAAVQSDLDNIAVSGYPSAPGDNSVGLAIARLARDVVSVGGQTTSIGAYYRAMITSLGVRGQEAQNMVDSEESILVHLKKQKDSISGVSLDEEAANLIKFQHAYNAAARAMTVFDELLDRLINGTGLVGR
jgi:flagellar hook-associated protein 1 FlgK